MAFVTVLFLGTVIILLDLQSKGVTVLLRNCLLFVVTCNYSVTFKISVTSNCNGTIITKNGSWIKSNDLLLQVKEITQPRYIFQVTCSPLGLGLNGFTFSYALWCLHARQGVSVISRGPLLLLPLQAKYGYGFKKRCWTGQVKHCRTGHASRIGRKLQVEHRLQDRTQTTGQELL